MAVERRVNEHGLWYCAECGCVDVEQLAWVTMNTGTIADSEAWDERWCPECERGDVTVAFAPGAATGDIVVDDDGHDVPLHSWCPEP